MVIVQSPLATGIRTGARPGSRDLGIDLVRALCVIGVVLLHAMMVGVTVVDGRPVFENASDGTWWIVPLSWALQVMPLFFVIGGFSGYLALRRARERGMSDASFLAGRVHRLLRPAILTIAAVGAALLLLTVVGVPADLITVAGFRYGQPLWFLAVFLLCQALLPPLVNAHGRRPLRTLGVLVGSAVAVDGIRALSGIDALGFVNLAFVWLALQQIGFFLADGRIDALTRRTRRWIGIGGVAGLLVAVSTGLYSPDLIANTNPPTTALLLVGVTHTCVLSLHRARLDRFSRHPFVAPISSFVNGRAMTVYLWHMPVLLGMAGVTAVASLLTDTALPALGSADWWLARPSWLATALAVTALVALLLGRVESAGASALADSPRRGVTAVGLGLVGVVLLLIVGTTPVTAAVAVVLLLAAVRLTTSAGGAGMRRPTQALGAPAVAPDAGLSAA